jgi:sarcosine oxidase subunit beta
MAASLEVFVGKTLVPTAQDFPATADVVVIGAGISGVSTAFFCSRLGLKTVVVEKRDGVGTLTTSRSTECFRTQFESQADVSLVLGSIEMFQHFPDVVGLPDVDIGLRPQGYLYATKNAQEAERYRTMVAGQHKLGLTDIELLTGDEVRRRFPWVSPEVIAARYRAGDGWLSVHELVQGFVKGSDALFLLQTPVLGLQHDASGMSAVLTSRGPIATRTVVVACGPFSGRVANLAGVSLPVTPIRRHRLAVLQCPQVPRLAPFTMDDDAGVYWRPEGAGALIGKAFEEEPEEPVENVPVDWTFPAMVLDPESPWKAGGLSPFWDEAREALHKANLHLDAGQYTYTPDHVPLIGPCAQVPGLYANTGYSGHGIMCGPEGGKRLSRLIAGQDSEKENPFSLARFQGQGPAVRPAEKVY